MPTQLNDFVSNVNAQMPNWGAVGVGLAAVVSWLGAIVSGIILARSNGRINRAADNAKDEMQRASSIAVAQVKAELNQAAETHKLLLKKQEWLFDKELEATNAFIAFKSKYVPSVGSHTFDTEDAAHEIGRRSDEVQKDLEAFRSNHLPVLTAEVRNKLGEAQMRFSYDLSEATLAANESEAIERIDKAAAELHRALVKIEKLLIEMVRS